MWRQKENIGEGWSRQSLQLDELTAQDDKVMISIIIIITTIKVSMSVRADFWPNAYFEYASEEFWVCGDERSDVDDELLLENGLDDVIGKALGVENSLYVAWWHWFVDHLLLTTPHTNRQLKINAAVNTLKIKYNRSIQLQANRNKLTRYRIINTEV